ncbi:hypothetical protein HELRODRAFT_161479 [Helobdella robusta]|uniref:Uncharacterized protein n=1 Tax=Helobdella robusta TaxID=6412 RepID=T1ERI7_HELRO|nr:hypothetical protein HELRODRAFT_161479 [Helobdella robusta]ESO02235.1 hypothetical protein HELRODRAFT_161479 [Helobdella robusta]
MQYIHRIMNESVTNNINNNSENINNNINNNNKNRASLIDFQMNSASFDSQLTNDDISKAAEIKKIKKNTALEKSNLVEKRNHICDKYTKPTLPPVVEFLFFEGLNNNTLIFCLNTNSQASSTHDNIYFILGVSYTKIFTKTWHLTNY